MQFERHLKILNGGGEYTLLPEANIVRKLIQG